MVEIKGENFRSERLAWGIVDVENPEHCDFIKLRSMLITHMQDLQEVTHDVHYENFRSERLAKNGGGAAVTGQKTAADPQKDKMLAEKDEELRRMQEMLAKMQEQIKQQSSTNLAAMGGN